MATVRPFRALRPPRDKASAVAAPPYEVINTREARALAEGNPDSFLHVSRAEIDLEAGVDEHSPEVYARAAENLADMRLRGVLVEDPAPRLYAYAQRMGTHRQVGVVACVSVDEYERGVIRKHENTRADKEDDRTRHVDTVGAHDEPVFLAYRAVDPIDAIVARATSEAPEYDFVSADGVGHTLWLLSHDDSQSLEGLFEGVPSLYVADGHHRSAAAARVHALREGTGGEHDRFLAVLFPDDQLRIMAYNRLVRDRMGRPPEAILAALGEVFDLAPTDDPTPPSPRSMCFLVGGRWHLGRARAGTWDASDPVASLDVSLCQDLVLSPVFGVTDPRRDPDIDFVGGIRGTAELERRAKAEGWSLAVSMFPTSIGELFTVSDAGRLMPPKSTWFEPKLRSGLFVHRF